MIDQRLRSSRGLYHTDYVSFCQREFAETSELSTLLTMRLGSQCKRYMGLHITRNPNDRELISMQSSTKRQTLQCTWLLRHASTYTAACFWDGKSANITERNQFNRIFVSDAQNFACGFCYSFKYSIAIFGIKQMWTRHKITLQSSSSSMRYC